MISVLESRGRLSKMDIRLTLGDKEYTSEKVIV